MPARPSRGRRSYEEDDYGEDLDFGMSLPLRRSRKVASYNEEEDEYADLSKSEPPLDGLNEDADGFDDEYDEIKPSRRSRARSRRSTSKNMDEDDDFFDDGASEEERFSDENEFDDDDIYGNKRKRRPTRNTFVATDDEASDDYGYGGRKRKRLSKKSTPTGLDEDDDDIKKEIEELYDSLPAQPASIKHKLRDRVQKVDYTIPPPLTNDAQLDLGAPKYASNSFSYNSGRGRKKANVTKNEYRKILFPTAGPFGGSDVISLFGTNIPPGGIPLAPGAASLTAIGQNLSDSDSSEDEIAPINGEATVSKKSVKDTTANILKLLTSGAAPGGPQLIGGAGAGAKGKKNNLSDTDPLGVDMNIDFTAVGGLDNYIDQLKEMVALPLLYPELYQNFKITPPRGVLFHGPPGTGKTLMARALASSYSTSDRKITFFMRKGADCLSKWVGEAERQLRLLFEEAKNQQPSIIFFDEIDGLAPVRSSKQEQIHASIVSTLLALMDGMDNRGQVIVIGATNRPDSIDPALRRPGRFDREFYFPLPDINARKDILKIHTKGWEPKLSNDFVDNLADLTKGYGGADLRALCTEAALNSIQRKYPQIYRTNDKLKIKPSSIRVIAKDFMRAVEKIIPSSLRSTSLSSSPLPDHLKALLGSSFTEITEKLNELLPNSVQLLGQKKLTNLDDAYYVDPSINDADGGFLRHQLLRNLENSRICKPHLLVCGAKGNGQQYVSSATLNYLEGFQVQSLDMGTLFGDPTRTPELTIIQAFVEARRHQPSILFIPNIDTWFQVVPYSSKATLNSLLRNLKSNEKILLLGIAETSFEELDSDIKLIFGYNSSQNTVNLKYPSGQERIDFFKTLSKTLLMKPYEFINDIENRPKRKLKVLKVVKPDVVSGELTKKKLKEIEYADTKLKNVLKIKLAGLMELFKNRYKRFKKPVIDENLLYHLYDPSVLQTPYEVLYEKSDDPQYEHMIKEVLSGRHFHNMDLDIIEERLWNGFYSEPKQFLKDIKMILRDAITFGDRERILKANEMVTNAQFGIDDFSNPEFLKACKEVREREIIKQKKILDQHEELMKKVAEQEKTAAEEQEKLDAAQREAYGAIQLQDPFEFNLGSGPYERVENGSSGVPVNNGTRHANELLVTIRSNGAIVGGGPAVEVRTFQPMAFTSPGAEPPLSFEGEELNIKDNFVGDLPQQSLPENISEVASSEVAPEANFTHRLPESHLTHRLPESNFTHRLPESNFTHRLPESHLTNRLPESNFTHRLPGVADFAQSLPGVAAVAAPEIFEPEVSVLEPSVPQADSPKGVVPEVSPDLPTALPVSEVAIGEPIVDTSLSNGEPTVASLANGELTAGATLSNGGQIVDTSLSNEPATIEVASSVELANTSNDMDLDKPVSESESESEVEELSIDIDRELIVTDQLEQLFEHDLIHATESFSIETLEIVTSKLMDIIWRDRNIWDKTETIAKLIEATNQLKETIH